MVETDASSILKECRGAKLYNAADHFVTEVIHSRHFDQISSKYEISLKHKISLLVCCDSEAFTPI